MISAETSLIYCSPEPQQIGRRSVSKFSVVINNKRYDVEVYEKGENTFLVRIGSREYVIYIPKEVLEQLIAEEMSPAEKIAGVVSQSVESSLQGLATQVQKVQEEQGLKVYSEIPGRVSMVMVREGDVVEQGQPLVVIESMKMAIEVRSPYRGRVRKVVVRENSFVDYGQTILYLDPL